LLKKEGGVLKWEVGEGSIPVVWEWELSRKFPFHVGIEKRWAEIWVERGS